MNSKPLGMRAYGSIGHIARSRLGKGDHHVPDGQSDICTVKARDKHDEVFVQEKLDGSCTAVARMGNEIVPLVRAGYLAKSSRFIQHHLFADWVEKNERRFKAVLSDGERMIGEWLAMAHGTRYDIAAAWCDPWIPFDIMRGHKRNILVEFCERVEGIFSRVPTVHAPFGPCDPLAALASFQNTNSFCAIDPIEGVVYRVERNGKVDFLAKYVRQDKVDGKYLPEISGRDTVWNWKAA